MRIIAQSCPRMIQTGSFAGQTGATLAESALILPFFLLILGAIVDFSLVVREYTSLTYAVSRGLAATVRQFPGSNAACADIENAAGVNVDRWLNRLDVKNLERSAHSPLYTALAPPYPASPFLAFDGRWRPQCFFCKILPRGISIRLVRKEYLERTCS